MAPSWSEIKRRARRTVHDTFKVEAIHYESGASTPAAPDDVIHVRVHDKSKMVGDLAGTNLSYAEIAERPTEIKFDMDEMEGRTLTRGSKVVGIDYSGRPFAYYVDTVEPPDGMIVTALVSPIIDMTGLLLPDGTTIP